MEVQIIKSDSSGITIQVHIPFTKEMLATEEAIQQGVNQVGLLATEHALSQFDTDGMPIQVGKKKYTTKGQSSKTYQCPFGEFELYRHVYQSNEGGRTYCPLDHDARILVFSTPKFAKMVSQKYSQMGSSYVQRDLKENHARLISRTYIRDISRAVGELAISKQQWKYAVPVEASEVSTIGISLDGTCMLSREDGWHQAMVGSISFYDTRGERRYTSYIAQPPEYGKENFYQLFTKEIEHVLKKYPDKTCVGVADGAADNLTFLQPYVQKQVLDYFYACEYLSKASKAAFKRKSQAKDWLAQACHTLKYEINGAQILLKEMAMLLKRKISNDKKEDINEAITYFSNHINQMDYPSYLSKNIPIGSGVIEAARKVIIKQRMNSGIWTDSGAKSTLILRCFNETDGKWEQFWSKITKLGSNIR